MRSAYYMNVMPWMQASSQKTCRFESGFSKIWPLERIISKIKIGDLEILKVTKEVSSILIFDKVCILMEMIAIERIL